MKSKRHKTGFLAQLKKWGLPCPVSMAILLTLLKSAVRTHKKSTSTDLNNSSAKTYYLTVYNSLMYFTKNYLLNLTHTKRLTLHYVTGKMPSVALAKKKKYWKGSRASFDSTLRMFSQHLHFIRIIT